MVKLLTKANDAVLSHCRCDNPVAGLSGQFDCPWCGCGWMIPCTSCGKSFAFGRVAEVDATYEAFVRADLQRVGAVEVLEKEVIDGAAWLRETFAEFEPGDIVVYLDGCYFRTDATSVKFEGLFARHNLLELPHAVALTDNDYLRRVMGDPKYWFDRERPDRHADN